MMNKVLFTFINVLLLVSLNASNNFWTKTSQQEIENLKAKIKTKHALNYNIDYNMLNSYLILSSSETKELSLPFPNGKFVTFTVSKNLSMVEELQSKFENIKTFNIQNKELNMKGKIDITHKGFHAMIYTKEGTLYIDPYSLASNKVHLSYWKKDFNPNGKSFDCEFEDENIQDNSLEQKTATANGLELRTYRIAVSSTGEYTQFHGGTVADGLAAIVTTINRLNAVYEKDFSVTLSLIGTNDLVVYTDPNTDPFPNSNSSGSLIGANNSNMQTVLGAANYDIGHVVGRGGSGLAGFGVVCNNNSKGRGTTGINNPVGDPFDIDYVAHEVGHQFAGSHTFNGNSGSCFTNISNSSAYEPGSGTTIMAYAGICGASNTQNFSNDYFHARTISQVVSFTTSGFGNTCPTKIFTNNHIPVIETHTANGFVIPKSTPFELAATASDADGDMVTFCWEQYDLGPQGAPNSPTNNAPLFRSFNPETTGIRVFPTITDILTQTQTKGEILADYQRDMNFRITVRDGNGATDDKNTSVTVNGGAGPFMVTSQNISNIIWTNPSQETITWSVANTNNNPINCQSVSILLSVDGGLTFPIILDNNVPNTGSAIIGVPQQFSNNARIKIKGNDNIFFNINTEDFSLNPNCATLVPDNITITNNGIELTSSFTGTNIWLLNGIVLPGISTQTFVPTLPGVYSVMAANNNCATQPSNEINITNAMIIEAGVSDFTSSNVRVFPNPTDNVLYILLDNLDSKTNIKLVDMVGAVLYKKNNINQQNKIDVSSFSKGIYYVVISDKNASYTQKVVID